MKKYYTEDGYIEYIADLGGPWKESGSKWVRFYYKNGENIPYLSKQFKSLRDAKVGNHSR